MVKRDMCVACSAEFLNITTGDTAFYAKHCGALR
jgi:hypothetical protein